MRTSSAMPSAASTLAKWIPAVALCGSGKWIASAARSAARSASGEEMSGLASPARTATDVRTTPRSEQKPGATRLRAVSWATCACVRMTTSHASPARNLSRTPPTAPKVPASTTPACLAIVLAMPCAAPPLRMSTVFPLSARSSTMFFYPARSSTTVIDPPSRRRSSRCAPTSRCRRAGTGRIPPSSSTSQPHPALPTPPSAPPPP